MGFCFAVFENSRWGLLRAWMVSQPLNAHLEAVWEMMGLLAGSERWWWHHRLRYAGGEPASRNRLIRLAREIFVIKPDVVNETRDLCRARSSSRCVKNQNLQSNWSVFSGYIERTEAEGQLVSGDRWQKKGHTKQLCSECFIIWCLNGIKKNFKRPVMLRHLCKIRFMKLLCILNKRRQKKGRQADRWDMEGHIPLVCSSSCCFTRSPELTEETGCH